MAGFLDRINKGIIRILFIVSIFVFAGSISAFAQCPSGVSTGGNATICETATYSPTGTATDADTYLWETSGDGTFINETSLLPTYTPGTNDKIAGSVTLTLTASRVACADAFDQMILSFTSPPVITNPGNQSSCDSYTLPAISGTNLSGTQAYYEGPDGTGTKYLAGASISASITLYIYDSNASCSDEENFTITIVTSPTVDDIADITACDSYTLPTITGTNLSGTEAYFTATGGSGTQYNSGQTISSTTTLFIYDINGSCSDEEDFTITIVASLNITNPGPQTDCDSYILPDITGSNLTGSRAYFTGSGGTGTQYNIGESISSTQTLYIYDTNGSCSDEENFTITIVISPTVDDITDLTACESYTLPTITGANLSGSEAYFTASGGSGTQYNPGQAITSTTTLFIYDINGSCSNEEDFTITIVSSPIITNPGNQSSCDTYVLPAISGTNLSGAQAYYAGSGGTGTKYIAGESISSNATLYIYDTNGSCSVEENFTITIVTSPTVDDIADPTVCDSYTLPTITGSNLSGTEAYYTATSGGGTKYTAGQIISSNLTLFIYDINGSCSDEKNFNITITNSPNITNPGNQTACDSYTLPVISGTDLSGNQAYYTGSGATGTQYLAGESISSTTTLYIYDANGSCTDEKSFSITITDTPAINSIPDQSVCNNYILPTITGTNLTGNQAYYTGTGGSGVKYLVGDAIGFSTTLYIYDENGSCNDEQSFNITITTSPTVDDITNVVTCDSYTLPAITGSILSGNQAYYTASGGVGTKYNPGDNITSSITLYIYDENGSCSDEENFDITINITPNITNPGNQSVCDSYTLPAISGSNLSGNQAYFTGSGGTGSQLNPGEFVSSTTTLYIYDTNGSCSYEENFTITITNTPSFTGVSNQTVCDAYTLPTITGSDLSGNEAYYTGTNGSGVQYDAGDLINSSTTLYVYDNNGSCSYQESFDITIISSPAINNPGAQFVCDSYTLPPISGSNLSGNESYYTGTNGSGVQYLPSDNITSTTILYIYDTNGSCSNEAAFSITVTNTPIVNNIADVADCDSYTLPSITGTNLTGNQAYYTASGGAGTMYMPGQILTSNITLYIYDNNGICSSEEQFSITVNATPTVDNPGNQTACDSYTLPPITGSNLSGGQAYYTAPNGGGVTYIPSQTLTTTTILYVYDANGSCFDQEQFTVNINNSPNITGIADQLECISYTLPPITGTNLVDPAYFTSTGGTGIRYDAGDIISTSTFLYIYDVNAACFDEENFTVTILPPPVVNDPGDQTECSSYQLPAITGTNLSGNQAYYTATNGSGTRYDAGDLITASDVIFVFDNNGSCTSEEPFDVTIVPAPTIDAGPDRSLCGITLHTLSGSGTGYDNSTISWNIIQGNGVLSAYDILNPVYTPTAGDYLSTVQLRISADGIGSCTGTTVTSDVILTYSENVIVDAGPASALICETQTYSPTPSTNTPSIYLWTTNGDGTFDQDNILNTTYTPGNDDIDLGTVTLTLEATGSGTCSGNSIDEVVLEIRSLPVADAGPAIATICEDVTYTTTDASAENYDVVSWAVIDGFGSLANAASLTGAEYNPTAADIIVGSARLRLTVTSNDPCYTTDIDDIIIEFYREPEITVGTIPNLCESTPYYVNIVTADYSSSVNWSITNGSGTLLDANTINPTYTPSLTDVTNGSVVLTIVAQPIGSCTNTTTQDITFPIVGLPTVELGSNLTFCASTNPIVLSPTITNGVTYLWSTSGTGTFDPSNVSANASYIPDPSDYAGGVSITLDVTGDAACSTTVSDNLSISFTPAPTAVVDATANICEGVVYTISSAAATNYSDITWTHDGNGTLNNIHLENPSYTQHASDAGNDITFTLTVTGNGTCAAAQDQLILSVLQNPSITLNITETTVCGASFQISNVTSSDYNTLTWTTSGNGSFDDANALNPRYTFGSTELASGIVALTLTASANSPCATDAVESFIIHIVDGPTADAGPDVSICETQNYVTSNATVIDHTSLEWTVVSGTGTFITSATDLSTTYEPSDNDKILGSVILRLTAYGTASCPDDTDDIEITIVRQPSINAGEDANACIGIAFNVSDASVDYEDTYIWTTDGYGSFSNSSTLTPSYTPHIDDINVNGGVVTLTLTASSLAPCAGNVIDTKILTIYNEPTAFAGNNAFVCAASDYDIQGATASYYSNLIWTSSSSGTLGFINNGTLTPTYHVNSADAAQGWVDITLQADPTSPCATPATHTFRLTVLAGPTADAGLDATICEDGTFINPDAAVTDAISQSWGTSGDGFFSSTLAIRPTYTPGPADKINGSVTLTLSANGNGSNGCNLDTDELTLLINKLPTADAGSMTEICQGSNVITGATAQNNNGVNWTIVSGSGNILNPTSIEPTYNASAGDVAAGTVVLQLEALPNSPCASSDISTISLTVLDPPTVDAGSNATVCRQTPYTLSGATSNSLSNTFQWTSSGNGSFGSGANSLIPTYTPSADDVLARTVTLTITASNGSCTNAVDFMTLNIESVQVDAGADAIICANNNYTFNPTIIGSNSTITWTDINGSGTWSNQNSATATYFPDAADAGTTVDFEIRVDESGTCSGFVTDVISIEIKNEPIVDAGIDVTICENETFEFPLSHATEQYTSNVYWTTPGDGIFSGGGTEPTYVPGAADIALGYVDLTIHGENSPCQEVTDVMRLSFSYLPIVEAGNNATVDVGASYTITTSSVSDASPILWTTSGTGTFTPGSEITISPTYTPSTLDFANGSVILTLTATPTGICTTPVSDYMLLTVTDHPPVDFYTISSCAGTITEFFIDQTVTDMATIASYAWDFGDGNTSSDAEPTHTYTTAGTYTVILTVTDLSDYTNIVQRDIEVNPVPLPNFTYSQPSCSGLTTEFEDQTISPSGYIVEWTWDFGDGTNTTITFPASNNGDIDHIYANSGTYQVILTVTSSDGCTNAVIQYIVVTEAPIANYTYSNTCLGNYTSFTDASTITDNNAIVSWYWNFGDQVSGINNTSTEQNPEHLFLSDGDYNVSLTVTNLNGCSSTFTDIITIALPPTLEFNYSSGCLDTPILFTVDQTVTDISTITDLSWDFGDGTSSTEQDPEHIYTQSGIYTVSLTALNLNGCSFTIDHQIEVYVSPAASFDNEEPTCQDNLVQFIDYSFTPTGTNITEWVWDFGDGNSTTVLAPSDPNVQHQYNTSGDYTVTLTITNSNGCESSVSKDVTILPLPIADFSHTVTCLNEFVEFTDQSLVNGGGDIASWNWDFGDPDSDINNTSVLQNPVHQFSTSGTDTFTISLQIENSQGCTDTITQTVVFNELPKVEFDIAQACLDTVVEFTVNTTITTVSEIASYLWEFGDGQTSNEQNPVHLYSVDRTYTVTLTVTDTAGCVNSVSHDLSLSALPQSLFGMSESQCNSDPIQFSNYSTTDPEYGYITEWHWDYGDGNDTIITHPGNPNTSHLYELEGTYSVTLTVTNSGGCSNFSTQEITILPGPAANFDFESVCLNVSANFIDLSQSNAGGQIVDWDWNFDDPTSGVDNISSLQNPSHLFNTLGDHEITLTVTNENGCESETTKTITIHTLPEPDFTIVGGSCIDGEITFIIDETFDLSQIQTIVWDFGDGNINDDNEPQPKHEYSNSGTFQITLTVIDLNGCENSVTKDIEIDQSPDVNFDTDAPSCEDNETQFNDLSSTSNFIVRWYWEFGDGTDSTINWGDNQSQNVAHIYETAGSYLARLTITTDNGCINTFEKEIIILPKPIADFYATTVCINHPVEFINRSQENNAGLIVDWFWDFGDPASGINNNSSLENPIHQYAESGTYEVTLVINNAEGCQDTYTDDLIVTLPPPMDPFTYSTNICENSLVDFFMSPNVNLADAPSILWDFGDPFSAENTSDEQNPSHIYNTPGEYIVTLTLDNNNCGGSISDTIIVNAQPLAQFEFSNACVGKSTIFTDISLHNDSPIEKWSWDFGIITRADDTSSRQNPTYLYPETGTHLIRLAITDSNGCTDTSSLDIEILESPISAFTFEGNFEDTQGRVSFLNESEGANEFNWIFGDGGLSFEENPVYEYSEDGVYSIELISWNLYNCSDTSTQVYNLLYKGLFIPNAFSPNNTNIKVAEFKAVGINLESYKIEVFDSWGNLVWESTALDEDGIPSESWDGTFRNTDSPSGVYIWKASGVFKDGTLWEGKDMGIKEGGSANTFGTITLIR